VDVTRRIHIGQYVILQLWNRLERVRHVLVLLDVADHLSSLRTFGKVDEVSFLDQRRNTILDERQIGEVNTCPVSKYSKSREEGNHTEERNARWVRFVQCFSIVCEVLGTTHELPHVLQSRH